MPNPLQQKPLATAADVITLHVELDRAGVEIWLDGGWAGDALLGEQTRSHEDVDLVIRQGDVPRLREMLEAKGYKDVERDDTSAWNFVLGDDHGHLVDVHAVVFDAEGNGLYGPPDRGVMYPAGSLTGVGRVGGLTVRCVSAEYLVKFHTGYKLREVDYKDVSALCARFDIDYPAEFTLSQDSRPGPAD